MSKNQKVERQARRDAEEYAGAYMAYGEGAGTRRKLIEGTVAYKMEMVPGYREAFTREHERQNMVKHAKNAKVANRTKAVNRSIKRNTRAAVTGKYENLNTGVLIVGAIGYALHKTGHDKTVIAFGKKQYAEGKKKAKKLRRDLRQRYSKHPKTPSASNGGGDDNVHRITDI